MYIYILYYIIYIYVKHIPICIFNQPSSVWSMLSASLPAFCAFSLHQVPMSVLRTVDERKLVDLLQSMAAKVKCL